MATDTATPPVIPTTGIGRTIATTTIGGTITTDPTTATTTEATTTAVGVVTPTGVGRTAVSASESARSPIATSATIEAGAGGAAGANPDEAGRLAGAPPSFFLPLGL